MHWKINYHKDLEQKFTRSRSGRNVQEKTHITKAITMHYKQSQTSTGLFTSSDIQKYFFFSMGHLVIQNALETMVSKLHTYINI